MIPGFNDSDDELTRLAEFLARVSPDTPWHVTAFHKDYKMTDPENTRPETLMRAAEIGKKAGLPRARTYRTYASGLICLPS